jgi:hypothetical protein
MTDFLTISNNGPEIISTNFYDSPMAKKGFAYLSWNAGTARLLLPGFLTGDIRGKGNLLLETTLNEIKAVSKVEISQDDRFITLLFEDNTDHPFHLFLSLKQTDRSLTKAISGEERPFTVWTRTGKQHTLTSVIII